MLFDWIPDQSLCTQFIVLGSMCRWDNSWFMGTLDKYLSVNLRNFCFKSHLLSTAFRDAECLIRYHCVSTRVENLSLLKVYRETSTIPRSWPGCSVGTAHFLLKTGCRRNGISCSLYQNGLDVNVWCRQDFFCFSMFRKCQELKPAGVFKHFSLENAYLMKPTFFIRGDYFGFN